MITFRQKEYTGTLKKFLVKSRKAYRKGKTTLNNIYVNPGKTATDMVSDAVGHPVNGAVVAAIPGGVVVGKVAKPVTDIIDKPLNKVGFGKLQKGYDRYLKQPVNDMVNGAAQSMKYLGGAV